MPPIFYEIFATILATVSTLLPISNPLACAAILPSAGAHLEPKERARQIRKACYYMSGLLITFLLIGTVLMNFFNISIPGLRIAGGLIVCKFGLTMLFPPHDENPHKPTNSKRDISFTPLAMPNLSGPGSIAAIISMSSSVHSQKILPIWLGNASVAIGILICALISWLLLRASDRLTTVLGEQGMEAISRIMGFFLICIGVQFVIDGISDVLHDPQFWPELLTL